MSPWFWSAVFLAAAAGWLLAQRGIPFHRLTRSLSDRAERDRSPVGGSTAFLSMIASHVAMRRRRSRDQARGRAGVRELCLVLADELTAGRTPAEGLRRAASGTAADIGVALEGPLTSVRTGGDVPAALREAAGGPGADGLRRLAACWQVGAGSGGGLALAVSRLAETLGVEEQHRHDVAAQLAGPRATTRLLAALPVIGLLMATGMGMRPLDFLLGSPYGGLCLIAGVLLDVLGVWWTRRLARGALGDFS